jgi:hypothetical protein
LIAALIDEEYGRAIHLNDEIKRMLSHANMEGFPPKIFRKMNMVGKVDRSSRIGQRPHPSMLFDNIPDIEWLQTDLFLQVLVIIPISCHARFHRLPVLEIFISSL